MTDRAGRLARASGAALLLLGIGLWIGGATGRVHALVRAAAASPEISPLDGSRTAAPRSVVLDGQPARLRRCVAPRGMSISQVRERYEDLAERESRLESGEQVPYIALDQPDGAYVLWTCVATGHRKGVIVQRAAGLVEYTLLDSEALDEAHGKTSVLLPGGVAAPSGSRATLTVEDGNSSFAFFEAPGAPASVADQVKKSLEGAGYAVNVSSADAMDLVSSQKRRGGAPRVVVPFQGKDKKGFIIVAASGPSSSRATVVLR